jgi:hypothetical protein
MKKVENRRRSVARAHNLLVTSGLSRDANAEAGRFLPIRSTALTVGAEKS